MLSYVSENRRQNENIHDIIAELSRIRGRRLSMIKGSVGTVTTQFYHHPSPLVLESGETLPSLTIAYETYGNLNRDAEQCYSYLPCPLRRCPCCRDFMKGRRGPGWWDAVVGPGKAFDTDRYFVICSNVIGGCKGSTGPSSENPATGKPYGATFPGYHDRGYGQCPETAHRSPRYQPALCSGRRIDGRHAGPPVDGQLPGLA